jgi:ABC-type antimicrobial peptide transport system permease subunit
MGLRHALARLAAAPMFTIFSVVSLAAGVAVTTAVYSVIDSMFVGDLGVAGAERVTFVTTPGGGMGPSGLLSDADFADLRAAQRSFASLSTSLSLLPPVTAATTAEVLPVEAVDGTYFATLAVGAQRGRLIQPNDDAAAARVAVLSDELWRNRYAADAAAIGGTIRVNGQPFEIIGIAPARYRGLFGLARSTRLWIPLAAEASLHAGPPPSAVDARDQRRLVVVGRLAAESTVAGASAELASIGSRLDQAYPPPRPGGRAGRSNRAWTANPIVAHPDQESPMRRFGLTLVALVALVLVVACTNIANLVLARGAARQGELAVRMALGASRGRLIREQCVESVILAGTGMIAAY